jgi:hypothetical protein
MIVLTCLSLLASLALTAAVPGDGDEAPRFAEELPGYYEFYKRAGSTARLDQEVTRDRSLEEQGEWGAVELCVPAPALQLPGSDGKLVPLRVGGEGRNTVVTTFQAWW